MILEKFTVPGLAHHSYLVGDAGEAVVIDPKRDVDDYLAFAAAHGLEITAVTETHIHADFVSGVRELAARAGARAYLSARGDYAFPGFEPVADGDEIPVGALRLRVLATPGHTPEHLAFVLEDPSRPEAPLGVFTGDALFFGSVGRPDLLGGAATDPLARALYASLHDKLMALPDATPVYPAHGAGSMCGSAISPREASTVGLERDTNALLAVRPLEAFVERITHDLPPVPDYWPRMKRENALGPEVLGALPVPAPVGPQEAAWLWTEGAVTVLDLRPSQAYGEGHVPASFNVWVAMPAFSQWVGWLVSQERPLLFVANGPADVARAVRELVRVGFERFAGYVEGGIDAWRAMGFPVETTRQVDPDDLAAELAGGRPPLVLDVRVAGEWAADHIPGALHIPLGQLPERLGEIPAGRELAVVCGAGNRSSVAVSVLERAGRLEVANVRGGMRAWRARAGARSPVPS